MDKRRRKPRFEGELKYNGERPRDRRRETGRNFASPSTSSRPQTATFFLCTPGNNQAASLEREGVLRILKDDKFVAHKLDPRPRYYLLYFSASW